jgi:glycosyltransferase involved in cell wall biosynthesis
VRIAVAAPDLRDPGGVREKALFVARALRDQLGASVTLLSLATARSDSTGILLHQPRTWTRSLVSRYTLDEFTVDHVGAVCAEIELARYARRRAILQLLAGCDAVHVVCGTPALANAVGAFRGPVVVHFASFVTHERQHELRGPRSALGWWRRMMTNGVTRIERRALQRADAIVAVNRTRLVEAQALARPETPVDLVRTGVDTEWFSPDTYRDDGHLLTVGRLTDPRKNVPLLLRGYAAARRHRPGLPRLVLAGPVAPDRAAWGLIAALGLTDVVRYVAPQDRRGLAGLYRGASMFVLSSDEEGQSIAAVEAMASGLPVIATSCVGPPEIITDGVEGLLTPVGGLDELARAIVRLDADPARRRRMSQAARSRALREFSLEGAGERLCSVYRRHGITKAGIAERARQAVSAI